MLIMTAKFMLLKRSVLGISVTLIFLYLLHSCILGPVFTVLRCLVVILITLLVFRSFLIGRIACLSLHLDFWNKMDGLYVHNLP